MWTNTYLQFFMGKRLKKPCHVIPIKSWARECPKHQYSIYKCRANRYYILLNTFNDNLSVSSAFLTYQRFRKKTLEI